MSVIHAPKRPEIGPRLVAFPAALGAGLLVLFLRLWYFQVVKASELVERANASQEMKVERIAPRGLVSDRTGRLLAGVRPELVVTAVPKIVEKHPEVIETVAGLVGTDPERLRQKLREGAYKRYLPVPIFTGASIHAGTRIAEAAEDLPGIGVEPQPVRFYLDQTSFTHVLGHVWTASARDVERLTKEGIVPAAYVGKEGIERAYERRLMGAVGEERMELDAKRRPVRVLGRDAATPGDRLTLTLDADLQKYTTALMGQGGFKGAVVALEPSTGEVLCMVSSPTYDQSVFKGGLSQQEWDRLLNDPRKPMLNRAIQTALAPGSTFKLVTAMAAYRNGQFDPNRYVYCAGGFKLGKKTFKCLGHHGAISFERAMEKSCNTYFATLGYAMGREKLKDMALELGLGAPTGIEIVGEVRGDLPTQKWLERERKPAKWYGGDSVNASLGQGAVATTPIQMATLAALVANEGVAYRPHLVREIRSADGRRPPERIVPEATHRFEASPEFWRILKDSLVRVIEDGTARVAQIRGLTWGGKTGSAEHRRGDKTHGWFVGIAPMDQPRIVVAVMIEAAGHGGDVAAPIAKEVVRHYLATEAKRAAASRAARSPAASPASR